MLRFLFEKKLIHEFMKCENCYNLMLLKKTKDKDIKYNWRCLNKNCSKYQTTVSVFRNSFFGNFHISFQKSLQILFYTSKGLTTIQISLIMKVHRETIGKFKAKIISLIQQYFRENPILLGGQGVVVNVVETMLNHKVKSHRGRSPRTQSWALTILDTSYKPSKGYAQLIEKRDSSTIIPIILRVDRPGTIIYTYEWYPTIIQEII
ncbi:hypothetical protein DMUE_0098 [Dictyocoela muelleri]|nr:hypothetical protein DMUE_0098 [Dictyocoela muelleri]